MTHEEFTKMMYSLAASLKEEAAKHGITSGSLHFEEDDGYNSASSCIGTQEIVVATNINRDGVTVYFHEHYPAPVSLEEFL